MQKHIFLSVLLAWSCGSLYATHLRSGEILLRRTGGLSVEATVVTYTKASSIAADRDSVTICWGDGTCEVIGRTNGDGALLGNDLKVNIYAGSHIYAAEGVYKVGMTDYNRTAFILNINPPNSDNVAFYLESSTSVFLDGTEYSSTPVFLAPPIDYAYTFQPYYSVPNAFDADGDSLAYALITPMAGPGEPVPNYIFPDGIAPADENKIYFNTETGEFKWDAPVLPGHYGIAILVKAYRNGQLVEQVIRDLSIEVLPEANTPPEIVLNPDINPETVLDVFVGQNLDWSMSANDPDPGQSVELSATGGPLEDFFANAAVFVANGNTANFSWSLQPEHVRQQPYQVVFKAKDDFQGNGLARTRVVRFRVNGTTAVQTPSLPLNVFPNPAVRQVDIQLPEALAENATLRVINAKGQCWHQQTLAAGARNHTLQLAEAPAGWYVLEVRTTRGGRFLGKLQKQ